MVGSRPHREELVGLQREDQFVNLERRRDREVNHPSSVHTSHTSKSHSRTGSHVSQGEETRDLKLEIDHLHRKLCRKQRKESPVSSRTDSGEEGSYKPRSRNPPSESFSAPSHRIKRSGIIGKGIKVRPIGAWE